MWSALGQLGAAGLSSGLSFLGGFGANKAAKQSVNKQLRFQMKMANNRYQYTMGDMKAAGLNPMLAYQQGGGPAFSGASYRPLNELQDAGAHISKGAMNAVEAYKKTEEAKAVDTAIAEKMASTDLLRQKEKTEQVNQGLLGNLTGKAFWEQMKLQADTAQTNAMTDLTRQNVSLTSLENRVRAAAAEASDLEKWYRDTWLGKIAQTIGLGVRDVTGGAPSAVVGGAAGALGGYASGRARRRVRPGASAPSASAPSVLQPKPKRKRRRRK